MTVKRQWETDVITVEEQTSLKSNPLGIAKNLER